MAKLLFPRKKNNNAAQQGSQHPSFLAGKEEGWIDDFKRQNQDSVNRNFKRALIICAVLLVFIIVVASTAFIITSTTKEKSVSAAESYSVSSGEINDMKIAAKDFASGLLCISYCEDESFKDECKQQMLSMMAKDTSSYANVANTSIANEYNKSYIPKGSFTVNVSEPQLIDGTRAYEGTYTLSLTATACKVENGNQANAVDKGLEMTVTFSKAVEENSGNISWVISEYKAQRIY